MARFFKCSLLLLAFVAFGVSARVRIPCLPAGATQVLFLYAESRSCYDVLAAFHRVVASSNAFVFPPFSCSHDPVQLGDTLVLDMWSMPTSTAIMSNATAHNVNCVVQVVGGSNGITTLPDPVVGVVSAATSGSTAFNVWPSQNATSGSNAWAVTTGAQVVSVADRTNTGDSPALVDLHTTIWLAAVLLMFWVGLIGGRLR
jgi:hypothetical protein